MRVRATQDGHYGGYYRYGPYTDEAGQFQEGEVFEVDATPKPMLDESGKPMQEMRQGELNPATNLPMMVPVWELDEKGKPKRDAEGQLIPKIKMTTAFSSEWMEPVNDDATISHPEQSKPLGVIPQMQKPKEGPSKVVAAKSKELPKEIRELLEAQKSPL